MHPGGSPVCGGGFGTEVLERSGPKIASSCDKSTIVSLSAIPPCTLVPSGGAKSSSASYKE